MGSFFRDRQHGTRTPIQISSTWLGIASFPSVWVCSNCFSFSSPFPFIISRSRLIAIVKSIWNSCYAVLKRDRKPPDSNICYDNWLGHSGSDPEKMDRKASLRHRKHLIMGIIPSRWGAGLLIKIVIHWLMKTTASGNHHRHFHRQWLVTLTHSCPLKLNNNTQSIPFTRLTL